MCLHPEGLDLLHDLVSNTSDGVMCLHDVELDHLNVQQQEVELDHLNVQQQEVELDHLNVQQRRVELDHLNVQRSGVSTPTESSSGSKRLLGPSLGNAPAKRPHLPVRTSLRGVTSGTLTTQPPAPSSTCWVFVDGKNWDVLLSILTSGSLAILQVFVRDGEPEVISAVTRLIGNLTIPVSGWDRTLASVMEPCHLSVVSYRVSSFLLDELSSLGISAVLTTAAFRRVSRPWRVSRLPFFYPC